MSQNAAKSGEVVDDEGKHILSAAGAGAASAATAVAASRVHQHGHAMKGQPSAGFQLKTESCKAATDTVALRTKGNTADANVVQTPLQLHTSAISPSAAALQQTPACTLPATVPHIRTQECTLFVSFLL